MNNLRTFILAAILSLPSLIAFFVVVYLLFSGPIDRCRHHIEGALLRTSVTGFVNLLFFGTVALLSLVLNDTTGIALLAIPGLLIGSLLALLALFGLTGVVAAVGRRMAPDRSPALSTAFGAAVVSLASLTPVVGWFLLFPFLLVAGVGASVLVVVSAFQRDRSAKLNTDK